MKEFSNKYRPLEDDESLAEYYREYNQNRLEESTIDAMESSWRHLESFIDSSQSVSSIYEMDEDRIYEFIEYLRNQDQITTERGVKGPVRDLRTMVRWFNEKGIISGNPFQEVMEADPFGDTSAPPKVHVPLSELRSGISQISHPRELMMVVTLLKTGLRIAELVNLDEQDVNINHPIADRLDSNRAELVGKPNSIYIDSSISKGDIVNGEERIDSNKPSSSRVVPLDTEVVDTLGWYLSMRPASVSDANPVMTTMGKGRLLGSRIGTQGARNRFNNWSKDMGWYTTNSSGVKPHWCRHWFTTTLRSNLNESLINIGTGDDYIDYLRGDTAAETKSDYIQMSWGNEEWMHEALEDALPDLL